MKKVQIFESFLLSVGPPLYCFPSSQQKQGHEGPDGDVGEDVGVESVTVVSSEEGVESGEVGLLGVGELSVVGDDVTVTVVSSDGVGVTLEGLDDSELVSEVGVTVGVVSEEDPVGPLGVDVPLQIYVIILVKKQNCKLTLKLVCLVN